MAHEFETGFFVKEPAWHKLGTVVQTAPNTQEAIKLAGLDWEVTERDLYFSSHEDKNKDLIIRNFTEAKTHKALVRATDSKLLGIVGKDYQALQNSKAFEFFDQFLNAGSCQLEAAGSLKEGKRVWVLAKLRGAQADVVKGDTVQGYLLLSNAHDGTQSVRVQFTTIRVVCWNTLSRAEKAGDNKLENCLRIRHSAKMHLALDAVTRAVDIANKNFTISVEAFQALAQKKIEIDGLKDYVREVFETPELPRSYQYIEDQFLNGYGLNIDGVKSTAWAAYNAVTGFIDHERGNDDSGRLNSTWFGAGQLLRNKAFNCAMALN